MINNLTKEEREILLDEIEGDGIEGNKIEDIQRENVLLSIYPKYCKKIKAKEKKWEFRKQIWKSQKYIDKIYLYETSPKKAIIGYFRTNMILKAPPLALWKYCNMKAGISREEFFNYFETKEIGYAIEISQFHQFRKAISPDKLIRGFHAPQNFMYVEIDIEEVEIEDKALLTEFIGCKVSKKLKEELENLAQENKKNLSDYIRRFIKKGLNKVKPKNQLKKPSLNPPSNANSDKNDITLINSFLNKPNSPFKDVINELEKGFENNRKLKATPFPKRYKHYYNDKRELRVIKSYFKSFKKLSKILNKNCHLFTDEVKRKMGWIE